MADSTDNTLTRLIKSYAEKTGFDLCGITEARNLEEHRERLMKWTVAGMNGDMAYLGQNIEKRLDPRILVPGAKSIIVTGLNYFTDKKQGGQGVPVISKYAYGLNYHDVILKKLREILAYIKSIQPETEGRTFVDSAPVLEKAWAREAGLGWPGRHSILINKEIGSFFFIGIIIINIELEYDKPVTEDYCGNCKMCVDACPTAAINSDRTIDARNCIAYLTIESKAPIAESLIPKLGGHAFGCDICQDVCPRNKKLKPHKTPEFDLPSEVQLMTAADWKNLSRKDYKRLFKGSPIGRRSYCRFMDNIEALMPESENIVYPHSS
jgi:epoxyqueuosine reductase